MRLYHVAVLRLKDAAQYFPNRVAKRVPNRRENGILAVERRGHSLVRLKWVGINHGHLLVPQAVYEMYVTKPGRDHHKDAFTVWVAGGGGARGGFSYRQTDDLGYKIVENPVHVHDFNATLLHLLGINHERLTFRYQGRQYRLTDVEGNVVREIIGT